MQYDLKTIGESALVKIMWHGAPTRVLVRGEGVKRDVSTGDVLEVTAQQAKELLTMSRLFTLDGDKPMKQAEPVMVVETVDGEGNKVVVMTSEKAEKLSNKKGVVEALKNLDMKFNDALSKNDLKALLVETLKERENAEAEAKAAAEAEAEAVAKAEAEANGQK